MRQELKEWIKIPDLKGGYLYRIAARNANYGIWISQRKSFLISRVKFVNNFLFEEHHWDCPAWATAKPIKEIEKSPFEPENLNTVEKEKDGQKYLGYINNTAILEYLNGFEGEAHQKMLEDNRKKWNDYEEKKRNKT